MPIPLPQWFTKGGDCCVKRKSIFENFPVYIKDYGEMESPDAANIPGDIMDELRQLRYKKPTNGPKFSPNMIRYALLLYYTSPQSYKLLLEQFPFPSISWLKQLSKGGIEPLKACKLLLEEGKMDKDVILSLDEIFLQKDAQYSDGRTIGANADGNLFKGVMTFMINCVRGSSIPFVVKACPELTLTGKWIADQIKELLPLLHKCGFRVRAIISDNHKTNVSAFQSLLKTYGSKDSPDTIVHPSGEGKIYLFYDSVHLLKNVRNNLLNARLFNFPSFSFHGFEDEIDVM